MKTYNILFSPTGGTAKVADAIVSGWETPELIDLTRSQADYNITLEENALALISMPSFGGVAPQIALDRLSQIQANQSKCAIVAVYGNRAYEDTLIQMKDYAEKAGFQVIAAIGAIAEHSIVRDYATGRPNADDVTQLKGYGELILKKAAEKDVKELTVPGNRPYKTSGSSLRPLPGLNCAACGLCAEKCPAGAINPLDPKDTDTAKCIACMRCVAVCPIQSRQLPPEVSAMVAQMLKPLCSEPRCNEIYL